MNDKSKEITYILLLNGSKIKINNMNIYQFQNNEIDIWSPSIFEKNFINSLQFNIIDYNFKKYHEYDDDIKSKIDSHNYKNILYKKFIYNLSNELSKQEQEIIKEKKKSLVNKLITLIKVRDYKNIKKEIIKLTNDIYNDDLCNELNNSICKEILDENKENFINMIMNDLITNKTLKNKILNNNVSKYINKSKYIILSKNDIDDSIINELYNQSKNIYIQFPNMFKNNNINKKYINN